MIWSIRAACQKVAQWLFGYLPVMPINLLSKDLKTLIQKQKNSRNRQLLLDMAFLLHIFSLRTFHRVSVGGRTMAKAVLPTISRFLLANMMDENPCGIEDDTPILEKQMKITGTFLDEISHDIPHQNWGPAEWDKDFASMAAIGIDTVILIRCGHKRWMTYPSAVLEKEMGCYRPPLDLVALFLEKAEKYGMKFYFGTYDSGRFWGNGEFQKEADINRAVAEEAWNRYGHCKAFGGWYLCQEVSRKIAGIIDIYAGVGKTCKELSGNLPVMISPYIDGVKQVSSASASLVQENGINIGEHERQWNEILDGIHKSVDIVAFQDGHCEYDELADFLAVNKSLAKRYGMQSWTNCESFDRDMPIKFLPIKWEKMLLKLEAAKKAGLDKAITFEFSHFMSPNSVYLAAANLYNRYREHFGL